ISLPRRLHSGPPETQQGINVRPKYPRFVHEHTLNPGPLGGIESEKRIGRCGPYRQASPAPTRRHPGARSARWEMIHAIADSTSRGDRNHAAAMQAASSEANRSVPESPIEARGAIASRAA